MKTDNFGENFSFVFVICLILFAVCAAKCCWNNDTINAPPTEQTKQARSEDLKRAEKNQALSDTVYSTRWKIKTKYDTILKKVMDSATVKAYYDSLVTSQDSAVKLFYHAKSLGEQLVVMDSVHTLDSLVKADLKLASLRSDTIIASLENKADSLTKQCRKSFWKGFKWGFGTGAVIGGAAVGSVK